MYGSQSVARRPERRGGVRLAFALAATAITVGLGMAGTAQAALTGPGSKAAPLNASPTLTVKVTHGGIYRTTSDSPVSLTDNGFGVMCSNWGEIAAATAAGSIPNGTRKGHAPLTIGTTRALRLRNCGGPVGRVNITVSPITLPIQVDSKTDSHGQTDVILGGINASVAMTGCSFTLTGSVPGYYTNGNGTLTLTPNLPVNPLSNAQLTVHQVRGCQGAVRNGDHPVFAGKIIIIKPDGTIIIINL